MTMDVDGDVAGGADASVAQASEAERFAVLKGAVKAAPTDYAAHLALVEYLRRERPGSLELSKARQGFSERFPLSPELWQEWIDDRRAAGGEDALEDVLGLYERAFGDYQCAKLWPGYLETLEESLDEDDEGGVSTMREAFERALSRVGVHPILGGAVWAALLRFEKEELEDAQETGADAAEVSKAQDRVKRVYRRRLSVPLVGNDELLEEAREAFSGDDAGFKEACHAHAKASKMLAARMEHEQVVVRCQKNDPGGTGAANAWEAYAAMEAADGHPSRAVLVLERAESEGCCLHERIWITHSDLLLAQMGANDLEETLTARAVRNLPWSAELWCRRLRSLERSSGSSSSAVAAEMRKVWKEALGSAMPSPDEYVKVLLAYCSSFRRRLLCAVEAAVKGKPAAPEAAIGPAAHGQQAGATQTEEEDGGGGAGIAAALDAVRGAFDEAEAFVDKNYPGWDEGWLLVIRQRIQVEDEVVEDMADLGMDGVEVESQARSQWTRALRHSGKRLASWAEAVKWERGSTGDLDACRRLYVRSLKEVQDFPEAACAAYLNFEQEAGSLEDWDAANKEVFNSRAARGLLSRDLPLASRAWAGGAAAQPLHQPTQRQVKNKKQQQQADRGGKRTGSKRGAPGTTPYGPPSSAGGGGEGEDAPHSGGASRGSKRARTAAAPAAKDGDHPAAAAAGEPTGKRAKAGKGSREEGEGAASGAEGSGGGGGGAESLTAFVVNLPFSTADAGLKEMFEACGEVTGTRVLSNPKGRSKGLGYVTFADEPALLKALALDGTEIDGRPISVQRSLPRGARPAKGAGKGGAAAVAAAPATVTQPPPPPAAATMEEAKDGGGGDPDAGGSKKKSKKKKKKAGGGESGRAGGGGVKWPAHPTTVFVRGLGKSATSNDLREAFAGAGPVLEARVVEDKKTGETKGYGLVQFEEAAAVEKALALDGTDMCGGTASITRSRHPAVVVAPAPAPASASAPGVAAETEQESNGGDGGSRRANDWDCPNPECDQVCFSFRTVCNRCGTGKDGTPPSKDSRQGGGGGQGAAAGEPVAASLHRPRLQLGAAIKPRALRNPRSTNGAGPTPSGTTAAATATAGTAAAASQNVGGAAGGGEAPAPAPSTKSNADFRALLTRK